MQQIVENKKSSKTSGIKTAIVAAAAAVLACFHYSTCSAETSQTVKVPPEDCAHEIIQTQPQSRLAVTAESSSTDVDLAVCEEEVSSPYESIVRREPPAGCYSVPTPSPREFVLILADQYTYHAYVCNRSQTEADSTIRVVVLGTGNTNLAWRQTWTEEVEAVELTPQNHWVTFCHEKVNRYFKFFVPNDPEWLCSEITLHLDYLPNTGKELGDGDLIIKYAGPTCNGNVPTEREYQMAYNNEIITGDYNLFFRIVKNNPNELVHVFPYEANPNRPGCYYALVRDRDAERGNTEQKTCFQLNYHAGPVMMPSGITTPEARLSSDGRFCIPSTEVSGTPTQKLKTVGVNEQIDVFTPDLRTAGVRDRPKMFALYIDEATAAGSPELTIRLKPSGRGYVASGAGWPLQTSGTAVGDVDLLVRYSGQTCKSLGLGDLDDCIKRASRDTYCSATPDSASEEVTFRADRAGCYTIGVYQIGVRAAVEAQEILLEVIER